MMISNSELERKRKEVVTVYFKITCREFVGIILIQLLMSLLGYFNSASYEFVGLF